MRKSALLSLIIGLALVAKAEITLIVIHTQNRQIMLRGFGETPVRAYVTNDVVWQNLTNAAAIAAANSTTNKP